MNREEKDFNYYMDLMHKIGGKYDLMHKIGGKCVYCGNFRAEIHFTDYGFFHYKCIEKLKEDLDNA